MDPRTVLLRKLAYEQMNPESPDQIRNRLGTTYSSDLVDQRAIREVELIIAKWDEGTISKEEAEIMLRLALKKHNLSTYTAAYSILENHGWDFR